MTLFQAFRLWARRAPIGERLSAAVGAALIVAVLAYLLVPASQPTKVTAAGGFGVDSGTSVAPGQSSAGSVLQGPANGTSTGGGPAVTGTGSASAPGPTGATGVPSGPGGTGGAGGSGCSAPPGTDQGLTTTQMKVAIALVNIYGPAGNDTFGIPDPTQQQTIWNAVIDSTNAQGGIACRRIVPIFFQANPADRGNLQQTCLDIAGSAPFAVFDSGSYSQTGPVCFAQNQLPYFGGYMLTQKQADQGFPYLFDLGNFDHLFHDSVLAFHDRGAFAAAKGFKKLGIYYHDCSPELMSEELAGLHQAGLQASQIVTYDFGCPTAFANPSDVEQAVLKFEGQGVTDVTYVDGKGDFQEFTSVAEQQGFRPQYLLADDELLGIAYGNLRPNSNNIANALIVTTGRNGEERTPGFNPTAGTARCDAILVAHRLLPTYKQEQVAGDACNQIWMLKAAVEDAPALQRNALAAGLQRARSIDFSYPQGPNDFSGARVTTAGQFWRVDQFFESCTCWRVIDPVFHPNYP